MEIKTIRIDLAKSVFQLHGVDSKGRMSLRKRLTREKVLPFMANLPRCVVGMEACGSAHEASPACAPSPSTASDSPPASYKFVFAEQDR